MRITNTISLLDRLRSQHQEMLLTEEQSLLIETNSMRQEFTNLFTSVAKYGELVQKLREKQDRQQEAQESGLIVPAVLLATDIEIFSAEQDKARANQRLRQIEKLADMLDRGLITKAEFRRLKQDAIDPEGGTH